MRTTKTQRLESEIAALTAQKALADRQITAFREWVLHESGMRAQADVLHVGGTGMHVRVHGMGRAAGGVCLVYVEDRPCGDPVLLDDLFSSWFRDPAADVRGAAYALMRMREDAIATKRAS